MTQVIALTEELLATAKQNEISATNVSSNTSASPSLSKPMENKVVRATYSYLNPEFTFTACRTCPVCGIAVSEIGNHNRETYH